MRRGWQPCREACLRLQDMFLCLKDILKEACHILLLLANLLIQVLKSIKKAKAEKLILISNKIKR